MKDTDTMTAGEFAAWMGPARSIGEIERATESRDAHRERQVLEAAAVRAKGWLSQYPYNYTELRATILNTTTFARGQLVTNINGKFEVWKGYDIPTTGFYPVSAHIDSEGRVIVDEVTP
jgi:hypothetical protein